jgi:Flp pilus assembly protein TadD
MDDCEARLRKNPDDRDALFTKATFLAKIGKYHDAMVCLERLAEIDQYYPGLWQLKAVVHDKMGDKRMARVCGAIAAAAVEAEVEGRII